MMSQVQQNNNNNSHDSNSWDISNFATSQHNMKPLQHGATAFPVGFTAHQPLHAAAQQPPPPSRAVFPPFGLQSGLGSAGTMHMYSGADGHAGGGGGAPDSHTTVSRTPQSFLPPPAPHQGADGSSHSGMMHGAALGPQGGFNGLPAEYASFMQHQQQLLQQQLQHQRSQTAGPPGLQSQWSWPLAGPGMGSPGSSRHFGGGGGVVHPSAANSAGSWLEGMSMPSALTSFGGESISRDGLANHNHTQGTQGAYGMTYPYNLKGITQGSAFDPLGSMKRERGMSAGGVGDLTSVDQSHAVKRWPGMQATDRQESAYGLGDTSGATHAGSYLQQMVQYAQQSPPPASGPVAVSSSQSARSAALPPAPAEITAWLQCDPEGELGRQSKAEARVLADITCGELRLAFHETLQEASKRLGICATLLKKRCRRLGIHRWPYRKVSSIRSRLFDAQGDVIDVLLRAGNALMQLRRVPELLQAVPELATVVQRWYETCQAAAFAQRYFDDPTRPLPPVLRQSATQTVTYPTSTLEYPLDDNADGISSGTSVETTQDLEAASALTQLQAGGGGKVATPTATDQSDASNDADRIATPVDNKPESSAAQEAVASDAEDSNSLSPCDMSEPIRVELPNRLPGEDNGGPTAGDIRRMCNSLRQSGCVASGCVPVVQTGHATPLTAHGWAPDAVYTIEMETRRLKTAISHRDRSLTELLTALTCPGDATTTPISPVQPKPPLDAALLHRMPQQCDPLTRRAIAAVLCVPGAWAADGSTAQVLCAAARAFKE